MTGLVWSGPAEKDLLEILEYYRAIDPDLAQRLIDAVVTEPLALLEFPKMGAPIGSLGVRKWQVRGTPFLLFYVVRPERIEIRRVRHAREDWRGA